MNPAALDLLLRATLGDDGFVPATIFFGTEREAPAVVVSGERVIEAWARLRALTEGNGLYPLVLGTPEDLEELDSSRPDSLGSIASMRDAAARVDLDALIGAAPSASANAGAWPEDGEPNEGFALPFDPATDAPFDEIVLALLPCARSGDVPATLGLVSAGLPDVATLGAALARWHDAHGAEIVGVAGAMMELAVERPPQDRESALALARERSAICPALPASAGSLSALAATLLHSGSWFLFWE